MMEESYEIPKSPLFDYDNEYQEVPDEIKKSFNRAEEADQPFLGQDIAKADLRQNQLFSKEIQSSQTKIPPPNLEECIQKVLGEDYKIDVLSEFSSEYTFNDKPKKPDGINLTCPFCLIAIDRRLYEQGTVFIRSKLLNQDYVSHKKCLDDFTLPGSKYKLTVLGQLSSVEYVLGGDEQEPPYEQKMLKSFKETFVEVSFYHPISNKPIYETIKKVIVQQGQQQSGIAKFRFLEGHMFEPPFVTIPLESFRIQLRISILDVDELQNKYQTSAVVTSKKFKVLPPDSSLTLKISNKKVSYKIAATTKSSKSILPMGQAVDPGCLIALNEIQIAIPGLFVEKKRKELFVAANHTTYSETGGRKRKKDQYIDLSPEVRSTNKSTNCNGPPVRKPQKSEVSESGISFRQYRQEQEKSRSDNSKLSYISKELNMEDIQNEIRNLTLHNYLKSQNGSRSMQKYINKCSEQDIDIIIKSIEPHIPALFVDGYANFFFKTLCEICSPRNRVLILSKIQKQIEQIAKDKKGTHSIQTLVSMMSSTSEESALYQMLEKHFISLSKDEQGTHIIKKMIPRLSDQKTLALFDKLFSSLFELATNQFGIIVVKELISRIKGLPDKRLAVLGFVDKSFDELIQNAFGNYAIQHVIETYPLKDCDKILSRILNRVGLYSSQKISSNVVEKCIMNTNEETKNRFIITIARDDVIIDLMSSKFGNFVLEKALKTSSKAEFKLLTKAMNKNLKDISSSGMKQKWQEYLYDYEY